MDKSIDNITDIRSCSIENYVWSIALLRFQRNYVLASRNGCQIYINSYYFVILVHRNAQARILCLVYTRNKKTKKLRADQTSLFEVDLIMINCMKTLVYQMCGR